MSTKTEICNQAIAHLGVGRAIVDLDTDDSAEAEVMRRFFDQTRKQVLRDHDWPFATAFITLTETDTNPTTEWAYAYSLPGDCIKFRRILSGQRSDTYDTKVPYRVVRGPTGAEIYSDQSDAVAEITIDMPTKSGTITAFAVSSGTVSITTTGLSSSDVGRTITVAGGGFANNRGDHTLLTFNTTTNVATYADSSATAEAVSTATWTMDELERHCPEDFAFAFSLRLAINVAPRISGGDNSPLVRSLYERYAMEIGRAKANASNETGWDTNPDAEIIRARG